MWWFNGSPWWHDRYSLRQKEQVGNPFEVYPIHVTPAPFCQGYQWEIVVFHSHKLSILGWYASNFLALCHSLLCSYILHLLFIQRTKFMPVNQWEITQPGYIYNMHSFGERREIIVGKLNFIEKTIIRNYAYSSVQNTDRQKKTGKTWCCEEQKDQDITNILSSLCQTMYNNNDTFSFWLSNMKKKKKWKVLFITIHVYDSYQL